MKRSLMVFTAIASFALPALAPVATLAQDQPAQESQRAQRRAERGDMRPLVTMSGMPRLVRQ